jgi:hypothetical protein
LKLEGIIGPSASFQASGFRFLFPSLYTVKRALRRSLKLRWIGVFSSPQSDAKVSSA